MKSPKRSVNRERKKFPKILIKSLPKEKRSQGRKFKVEIKKSKKRNVKKSRTRGWAAASPQKGNERQALFKQCGPKCFLLPDNLKYPVCESLRVNKNCKFSCRGIISAKIRASQKRDPSVVLAAERLEKKVCKKSPKRQTKIKKQSKGNYITLVE
uniref:Uncharacterized protein n=1 Tax=viral metagenome TaxID=1070528 RepID=A0A6C0KUB1_9ZZZZ